MKLLKVTTEKGVLKLIDLNQIRAIQKNHNGKSSFWFTSDEGFTTNLSFDETELKLIELGIKIVEL